MPLTSQDLIYTANLVWPSYSPIGYLALLKGDLLFGANCTADPITNEITFVANHGLVTGSRLRLDGTLPTGLAATQDYYAVLISPNAIQIAATLADAQALTFITLPTAGSGLLCNEQLIKATDPYEVLINKELSAANGYQRMLISGLQPAASTSATTADHPPLTLSLTNIGSTTINHRHEVILRGAGSAVGSTAGITAINMRSELVDQPTAPSQTRDFVITLGASDP